MRYFLVKLAKQKKKKKKEEMTKLHGKITISHDAFHYEFV